MATTVPVYSFRKRSSQATDSASRWLVGSSSNSMSGFCSRSRHSATRRRSPPEILATSASPGGTRSASIASSTVRSSAHAFLDVPPPVLVGVERRLLGEIADAQPVGGKRLAQEVVVGAGHDAQQRGFAGAVGAQHADLGAVEERQVDAAQDLPLGRDDLAQVLHRERVLT